MSLQSPEFSASKPVTMLVKPVTEIPGLSNEITIPGENVAQSKWALMLDASSDGAERSLTTFYNRLTKKFTNGPMHKGTKTTSNLGEKVKRNEDQEIFLESSGLFREPVVVTHDHLTPPHLATDIPSDYDVFFFLMAETLSASIMVDRNGAHLIIRTRKRMESEALPPQDLIEKAVKEAKEKDQTSTDVQKRIDSLISPYGLRYLYHPGLDTNEDGTVTFKKP
jgi:hypothetical protein